MKSTLRIVLCAIVGVAAVSFGPTSSALPPFGYEITYYNGANCPNEQIGYEFRECDNSYQYWGEVDGPNATYKIVDTHPCHGEEPTTKMYSKECGQWWGNNYCYIHICTLSLHANLPLT